MKTDISITFNQNHPWGCGLYSVAHAMGIESFVTQEREKLSKRGNNISELTKWLLDDGYDYGIDVFFYDHFGDKLPASFTSLRTDSKDILLPVMIQVKYSESSLPHLIGGRINHENNIYLFDSYREWVEVVPLSELNEKYHQVTGMFGFSYLDGSKGWVFINV